MAIDFKNRDPNQKDAVYSVKPAQQSAWIETSPDGAWTGKFSATKPRDAKGWREVGYATVTLNDGRKYRAVLDGNGQPISEIGDSTEIDDDVAQAWNRRPSTTAAAKEGDIRGPQTGPTREVYRDGQWVVEPNPVYQAPASQQEDWHTEGTPLPDGTTDNTRPIMARTVNGVKQTRQPTAKELEDWNLAQQMTRNPGGKTDAQIAAETPKPTVAPGAAGQPAVQYVPDPDHPGQVKAVPIPGAPVEAPKPTIAPAVPGQAPVQYVPDPDHPGQVKAVPIAGAPVPQGPPAEQLSAPSDQMWIVSQKPGQPPEFVKNPNYIKPSRIMPDPGDPTKLINVTRDDNGNVISLPVTGTTVIKPADLPVLQANYGQIAQGLGALAQDLNSRYARGEITEKQKNDAFTAAHQQAQTQVSEINSILTTSKAIWAGELEQRGQSLGETQSRRGFAQNIFDRAAATGMGIATSAGPGHGKAIAGGVQALMNMGQQYAEGMGGFRESPEIPLPAALQQARGIGLPGFPTQGTPTSSPPTGAPPGVAPAAAAVPPAAVAPPVLGPARDRFDQGPGNTLAPREMTPASSAGPMAPAAGFRDPGFFRDGPPGGGEAIDPGFFRDGPPGGGEAIDPGFFRDASNLQGMQGQNPMLAAMGQQLQSGLGFGGAPVAAGGLGVYDPSADVQSMIGDGADPTWAEAVSRAAAEVNQPGYAWQRFSQPASRFG